MKFKAMRKLLDECARQGPSMFGFINYIPYELVEDAQHEYDQYRRDEKRATSKSVRTTRKEVR